MATGLRAHLGIGRIGIRLLAFNALLVFVPVVGILYLDVFERQLLAAQERSMVQQGRVLAAALSGPIALHRDEVERILRGLDRRITARLRVVDADGLGLGDSSQLGPRRQQGVEAPELTDASLRSSFAYRLGSAVFRLAAWVRGYRATESEPASVLDGAPPAQALQAALAGRYGAATRISPGQRSVTLYSAVPIRGDGSDAARVVGAVIVSQSTYRLLGDLVDVRVAIFRVFLASLAMAAVLTLVATTTISRPLRRLRREAAQMLDHRGRLRRSFGGAKRGDEIGDLARALETLSGRLEAHIGFFEAFAADLSHEFKNPLTSIRAATEVLADVDEPEERARFVSMIERDVARLEHLLSSVREMSEIDSHLGREARAPVELNELLRHCVEAARLRTRGGPAVRLRLPEQPVVTLGAADRLAQVFENLLENALSFSPTDGFVDISLAVASGDAVVRIRDQGPGVPEAHRTRIFERFFTYREEKHALALAGDAPAADGAGAVRAEDGRSPAHTGLGLAIVKAIVEGHAGSVRLLGDNDAGAAFEVVLPLDSAHT